VGHSERYSDLILTGQSRPTLVVSLLFSALFTVAQRGSPLRCSAGKMPGASQLARYLQIFGG